MAHTAAITLAPAAVRSVRRRHPWVFSGGVVSVEGDPQPGDTVLVRGDDGTELGWAAYSPASRIRARMWTFAGGPPGSGSGGGRGGSSAGDPVVTDMAVTEEFVRGRVLAAAERRAGLLAASDSDSARLVFSEADGVPGLIADRYGDTVVCQLTTAGAEAWREVLADALAALPGVRCVFERSDADVRSREGLAARSGLLRGQSPSPDLLAHERGWRFAVDVQAGHKTGFYLDQRDGRAAVAAWASGRRVLNVFSYTGAFSVIAAACGATTVTSIESSAPALAVAGRNGALNGVDVGELIEGDAFTVLRGLRDRARQYDLILLDPPKLAATDSQVAKATRAYKDLNLLAAKLLAPGGVLVTWSCSGSLTAELFQKVVAGAALDAGRDLRIIGRLHQPADHPVPLGFPEAEYLKGLILQAP